MKIIFLKIHTACIQVSNICFFSSFSDILQACLNLAIDLSNNCLNIVYPQRPTMAGSVEQF